MRTFDSDLYGSIPEPESFAELLMFLEEDAASSKRPTVRMWRGQGNIAWTLDSTAYRRVELSRGWKSGPPSEDEVASYERTLLEQARYYGHGFAEGRELADFELLARLRHHGAATRLVDATRNALVALWFTVSDQEESIGALFGFHSDYLHGHEGKRETRPYDEVQSELSKKGLVTWEPPPASSTRIASQNSQYLYSKISNERTGSLHVPEEADALLVVAISPAVKRQSVRQLKALFDIREYTLFPDLEGFSRANRWRLDAGSVFRW